MRNIFLLISIIGLITSCKEDDGILQEFINGKSIENPAIVIDSVEVLNITHSSATM